MSVNIDVVMVSIHQIGLDIALRRIERLMAHPKLRGRLLMPFLCSGNTFNWGWCCACTCWKVDALCFRQKRGQHGQRGSHVAHPVFSL